jgi:hypothetical protein
MGDFLLGQIELLPQVAQALPEGRPEVVHGGMVGARCLWRP